MEITPFGMAVRYDAPLHEDVHSLRLQGADATDCGFCSVGLSYYLPGGKASMSAGATDKLYVMIDGELLVTTANGTSATLSKFDSCFIRAGEAREAVNKTNHIATLLVVIAEQQS